MLPLILDVDTGEDDALAILLAVRAGFPLKAVISSFGNASVEHTTRNTASMVALSGAKDCVVWQGAARPIQPHLHFVGKSTEWESAGSFVGENGLCGLELPNIPPVEVIVKSESERIRAWAEFLTRIGPVDYCVTCPCTNLAQLCLYLGDKIHSVIRRVSMMGGALHIAGNSGPRDIKTGLQIAEFNFYCDPFAADIVLRSGLPISLVGWDTTSRLTISAQVHKSLTASTQQGRFTIALMQRFLSSYGVSHNREFEFNDPAALLLSYYRPQEFISRSTSIVLENSAFGRLKEDPRGTPILMHRLKNAQIDSILRELLRLLDITIPSNVKLSQQM